MNKKSLVFCFIVVLLTLFSLSFILGEVRINEVELNPPGSSDSGNEWIELYSDIEINLTNWIIRSSNGRNMTFNASFSEYYTLNTSTYLLTDSDNTLTLRDNSEVLVFTTSSLSDSYNDDRTWQYCSGNWSFINSTLRQINNCTTSQTQSCIATSTCSNSSCTNGNITQTCINTLSNCTNSTTTQKINCSNSGTTNPSIFLNLTWTNEEIINSENFNIEVKAFNLLNYNYDLKIWLEFKNNETVISDRYDENEEGWKSGTYFVTGFFSENGNKTKDIMLRLREDYTNFSGEARIFAKLRMDNGIINQVNYTITLLEKTESDIDDSLLTTSNSPTNITSENTNESSIIKIGSKTSKVIGETEGIKTEKSTIYKSKNEYIKEYAIYGFAILCVLLIILLLIDKK